MILLIASLAFWVVVALFIGWFLLADLDKDIFNYDDEPDILPFTRGDDDKNNPRPA